MKQIPIAVAMMSTTLCLFANSEGSNSSTSCSNIQYWVDGSFTYWYSKEDGLNVAESAQVDDSGTTIFASSPKVFQQNFGYRPGFKVGIGLSFAEDWKVHGEYTYYRAKNHTSQGAPAGSAGVGVWSTDNWYLQETFFSNQSLTGTSLSSTWKISMDMVDFLLSPMLKKEPGFSYAGFIGLRTVWIRQKMNLKLNVAAASFGGSSFLGPQPVASENQSHAWGIGPRLGMDGRYNLPLGLSIDGSFGATLFFSRFTNVRHSEGAAATYYAAPASLQMDYNSVRPELDLGFGLGWQMDIGTCQHIEVLASYDFSYFWGQNMMRSLVDQYAAGVSSGNLDLYFQGLTLKLSYGF